MLNDGLWKDSYIRRNALEYPNQGAQPGQLLDNLDQCLILISMIVNRLFLKYANWDIT